MNEPATARIAQHWDLGEGEIGLCPGCQIPQAGQTWTWTWSGLRLTYWPAPAPPGWPGPVPPPRRPGVVTGAARGRAALLSGGQPGAWRRLAGAVAGSGRIIRQPGWPGRPHRDPAPPAASGLPAIRPGP